MENDIVSKYPPFDAFILGLPKCGTTWLSEVLSSNPSISFSIPKEPNLVASRVSTFDRSTDNPNFDGYDKIFSGEGFRIDGSVHTFACPHAPSRILEVNPQSKFIICLREPIDRAHSHWKMIRDIGSDISNDEDWDTFEKAWDDARFREESLWAKSMQRWLDSFDRDSFYIIDSSLMKSNPNEVLDNISKHLGLPRYEYDLTTNINSNRSMDRRKPTIIGSLVKYAVSLIPESIRIKLSKPLQKRSINIYNLPLVSRGTKHPKIESRDYLYCSEQVISDLVEFEDITGFKTSHWINRINEYITQ